MTRYLPFVFVILTAVVVSTAPAADDLLYYVSDDGAVVITNTPSRADARPIPGQRGTRSSRAAVLPASRFDRMIDKVAERNGLSPDLVKAVAMVESGLNPRAVSVKGAQGLMQLMPATAASYGVSDPFDPYQNLQGGARHLRDLLDEFGGDLTLALAAYNAGSGAVRRYGGVPAYRETRDYVRKIHAKLGSRAVRRETAARTRSQPIRMVRRSDGVIEFSN